MKFSYAMLRELVDAPILPSKELADLLTMRSFESEGVFGEGEQTVLDLDILPNRASDAASHIGVAREIAALLECSLKNIPKSEIVFNNYVSYGLSVDIKKSACCDRYCAVAVNGVAVKESPDWIKERLAILGLNSINNIVDATNYAMLQTGQPLHAFDYDKLAKEKKIIVRPAKSGEKIETLDGSVYDLEENMEVIADDDGVLAIAGIKGGRRAEIDENTKRIVIESAHFTPLSIRRTSRALSLNTDASWRFERGVPVCFSQLGASVAANLILSLAGGELEKEAIDINNTDERQKKIVLEKKLLNKLLGISIESEKVIKILKSLEFSAQDGGDVFVVSPPPFRLDVSIKEDVIEEVARVFGYDMIEKKEPKAFLGKPVLNDKRTWKRRIISELASYGFFENHTIVFEDREVAKMFPEAASRMLELENPINETTPFLRVSLLPNMIKSAGENVRRSKDEVRMFELGSIFMKIEKNVMEKDRVALVVADKKRNDDIFYDVKGAASSLLNSVGIWEFDFYEYSPTERFFNPNKSARIMVGDNMAGYLGEVYADKLGLKTKGSIVACEIDLDFILGIVRANREYKPVSKYPAVLRDISLFVPYSTRVADVERVLWGAVSRDILADVDMFDYFDNKEEGVLGMAFRLTFQSQERTLSKNDVEEKISKVENAISQNINWEIR